MKIWTFYRAQFHVKACLHFLKLCMPCVLSIYTYIYLAVIPHVSSWSLVSSNSIPRCRRRKNAYKVCPKKTQSRSDYFEGAKRHNPVAKRLFAGAKRLLRAEGACCWRRRRLVQGKNTVAKRLLQARSAYYAPKAPVVGAEGACYAPKAPRKCYRRRRRLAQRAPMAPKAPDAAERSGAASTYIHQPDFWRELC